jgi:lysophospholipase L1-like esterase
MGYSFSINGNLYTEANFFPPYNYATYLPRVFQDLAVVAPLIQSQSAAGKPIFIFATGQSERVGTAGSYTWQPNFHLWNNAYTDGSVGTAFTQNSAGSNVNDAIVAANLIAKLFPTSQVYLVIVAVSGQSSAHWISGATGANMWGNILANVVPALAAVSLTTIDQLWVWQGKSDNAAPATWTTNWGTIITSQFKAQSWFPQATPVIFTGISPTANTGTANDDILNAAIAAFVEAEPAVRSFVSISDTNTIPSTDYGDTVHPNATGYVAIGKLLAQQALSVGQAGTRRIITGVSGAPASSGTLQTNGVLRLQSYTLNGVLDFGVDGGNGAWLQSVDKTNLASNLPLGLNRNGGLVFTGSDFTAFGISTGTALVPSGSSVPTNGMYLPAANTLGWGINSAAEMQLTATALSPAVSDGNALGTISLMWSDAFFASGAVINFNNGDVTITHSTDALAFAGAATKYTFDSSINIGASGTPVTRCDIQMASNGGAPASSGTAQPNAVLRLRGGFAGVMDFGTNGGGNGWIQYTDATDLSKSYTLLLNPVGGGATGGVIIGVPTGGDKGYGTLNASAVYDDGTLLTCPALAKEFIETGTVDTGKWDAFVPDQIIPEDRRVAPERIEKRPLLEPTGEFEVKLVRQDDGSYLRVETDVPVMRQVHDWVPIYDAAGNGLDAVPEAVVEEIIIPAVDELIAPERRVPRKHRTAHLFKAMIDEGFDPRDPAAYIAKLKRDQALPGMPTQADWTHGAHSLAEIHNRLWLATEMLALVVVSLTERVAKLEGPARRR